MKPAKLLKKMSGLCFLLVWIPFAVVMINGPLRLASGDVNEEQVVESLLAGPWLYALGALFAGTFIFFIASMIVGGLANRRILTNGQDAEAKILDMKDTGTRTNDNPEIEFTLEIQPANYPAFVGQALQTVSIIELPSYQRGKNVYVRFIPETNQVAIVGPKFN
jgi:hypothetical protein